MSDEQPLLERVKSELRDDLLEPYEKSHLAQAAGLSREQWDSALRESQHIAEMSAIWSLKVKMLQRIKERSPPVQRRWPKSAYAILTGLGGGVVLSYIGASENLYRIDYADFFNYHTGTFALWFAAGLVFGFGLAVAYFRLPDAQRKEGCISTIAGAFLAILVSFGPGRRGALYWLAHGGMVRIAIGMIGGLLIFEIWRHRQR